MSDSVIIDGRTPRNRVLSVFAGLSAISLYISINGSVLSVANAAGLMDGWSFDAAARFGATLDAVAWLLAALGVITIGWWLRRQGSIICGAAGLTFVGLADGALKALNWFEAMQPVGAGEPGIRTAVSYFPFMMPVLVLVGLLLLGAGAQILREKFR